MPKPPVLYVVTAAVTSAGVVLTVASYLTAMRSTPSSPFESWSSSLLLELGAGIIQAVILFFLLDQLFGRRDRVQERLRQSTERNEDRAVRREELQVQCLSELRQAVTVEARQVIVEKMRRLDLSRGADFAGFDLSKLNLTGCDLREARFVRASLIDTNLREALLGGADFSQSFLLRVDVSHCEAQSTCFRRCEGAEVNFQGTCLQRASFELSQFPRSIFDGADLRLARLDRARLEGSSLVNTNLRDAGLSGADLSGARLVNADLSPDGLQGTVLSTTTVLPSGSYWRRDSEKAGETP